jgi:hypothetical protein
MDLTILRCFIMRHKLAAILVIGVIVRLILMPISAHPFDVSVWYGLSENILKDGPWNLQAFPPLWYHYMMVPIAYGYSWLSGVLSTGAIPMTSIPPALDFYPSFNIQYVPGLLFNFVVKIPFLISDVVLAVLLYKIVREITKNKGLAEKAAMIWFLNPFVIWISVGWGMWDTLTALFSVMAFYFLLKKKFAFSAVSIGLGVASKLYPVLFLVPIVFYILKVDPVKERLKHCLVFFSGFVAVSLLLFFPYLSQISSFFGSYFLPSAGGSGAITDPVVNPLGFGLTYWSTYLLNRLIHIPVSSTVFTYVTWLSVVMVAVSLLLVFWKTSKFRISKPVYDLAFMMLLPVIALFLSYRIICEQWFVWLLPFLVILYVDGRIRRSLFWGASAVALLYSVMNCPLPFFFLPLVPWYSNSLLAMVYAIWAVEPMRIITLAVLGCVFSVLLIFILFDLRGSIIRNRQ